MCAAQGLNEDANMVQTATGEKVGQVLHHLATFVGGIIIGFIKGWRLALVSTLPAVGLSWALKLHVTLLRLSRGGNDHKAPKVASRIHSVASDTSSNSTSSLILPVHEVGAVYTVKSLNKHTVCCPLSYPLIDIRVYRGTHLSKRF